MNNNDNLVDIVYSETIDRYVIILKRFTTMPVVMCNSIDFNSVINLLHDDTSVIMIYDGINGNIDNHYY